jgi:hypothetical protein
MTLSPRQIYAWLDLNDKIDNMEHAASMVVTAVAAQGDKAAIEKTHRELTEWR